jgi:putative heme degradation protein
MSIAVQPTKASRIRAAKAAQPTADERTIAERLGVTANEVRVALRRGGRRRIKSVAPAR